MFRCKVQMSVEKYRQIKDQIVSREEGAKRKQIDDNYDLINNKFVPRESPKAPLGIVSKDPADEKDKFNNWLSTNSGFIEGLTSSYGPKGVQQTVLNDIQRLLIDADYQFLWMEKTRQFGFSYLLAAKALAESMILYKHTDIFISYNEEESKNKIIYARELYDTLPTKYKLARKLKYDNKTSLVFERSGQDSVETRILSYPQREIRGKGGDVHVKFDEAAHCIHFKKLYRSALPVLSRGRSSLWIGSSPAGKGGLFYDIKVNADNNYSPFYRIHVNWWDVPEFCTDVKLARETAPFMITDERVERFASHQLKLIRNSMILEDFQQEYECAYLDEAYSYYSWDLIMSCVPIFNMEGRDVPDFDAPANDLKSNDKSKSGAGIDFFTDFDQFMRAVDSGMIKGPFLGGFDVGRTIDASEVVFVEETKDNVHIPRCNITMKNTRTPEQREFVKKCIDSLGSKLLKFGIDYNGIGMTIAEDLEDHSYELVEKLPFNNNAWKEEAARNLRYRIEFKKIMLPTHRPLLNQIHSIKRILLPSGKWRFDADTNEKHHGDKFWGLIAACEMGKSPIPDSNEVQEFDKRMFAKKSKQIDRIQGSEIILPDMQSVLKFNPYRGTESMHGYGNIPRPKLPSLNLLPGSQRMEEIINI